MFFSLECRVGTPISCILCYNHYRYGFLFCVFLVMRSGFSSVYWPDVHLSVLSTFYRFHQYVLLDNTNIPIRIQILILYSRQVSWMDIWRSYLFHKHCRTICFAPAVVAVIGDYLVCQSVRLLPFTFTSADRSGCSIHVRRSTADISTTLCCNNDTVRDGRVF